MNLFKWLLPPAPPKQYFYIAVKRQTEENRFTFDDLDLSHQNCGGGKLIQKPLQNNMYELKCERCKVSCCVYEGDDGVGAICLSALDGQQRELGCYFHSYEEKFYNAATVIVKTDQR